VPPDNDPDCDYAQGSDSPPSWDSNGGQFALAPAFLGSSALGFDPDVDGAEKAVVLRYGKDGTQGWGGRHIVERHGWTAAAERDTRLAIAFGYRDTPTGFPGSRSREYTVPLPQRNIAGKLCGRHVVAQLAYNPQDADIAGANGQEKGLITSFGFARP
jgi:hypothetical protein